MNSKRPKRFPTYDVFVGNIPTDASEKDVAKLFTCFGETSYISVREGSRNDGTKVAFIHYLSESDAETAINERSGHMWDGMLLVVNRAQRRNENKSEETAQGINKPTYIKKALGKSDSQAEMVRPFTVDKVLVTHVEDACTFWAQSLENSAKNSEMMDNLFEFCSACPQVEGKPALHKVYATIYSLDSNWYRCTILQHVTDEKCMVKYTDYGNAEIVENQKIVNLPEELSCVAPLTQRYRLDGLFLKRENTQLVQEGTKFLKNAINENIITIQTYKTDKYMTYVDVVSDESLLSDEIMKKGYAVSTRLPASSFEHVELAQPIGIKMGSERNQVVHPKLRDGKMPHPIRGRTNFPEPNYQSYKNVDHPFLKMDNRSGWGDQASVQIATLEQKHKNEIKILHGHLLSCKQKLDEVSAKPDILSCVESLSNEIEKVRRFRQHFNTVDNNDWLEEAALILLDENARVLSQNLLHLPAVKQALNRYHSAQKAIKENIDKDKLDELINERDEMRRALHDGLVAFLVEIKSLPLETRYQTLNDCIKKLEINYCQYLNRESPGPVPLKNVLEAYKEWKLMCYPAIKAIQMQTDRCVENFQSKLNQLSQGISLNTCIKAPIPSQREIAECMRNFTVATRNEIDKCTKEEKEGFKVLAMMATQVFNELTQESDYVKQLKHSEKEYSALELALKPWLSDKPILESLNETKINIRMLRSKLRHKLADQKDLEEENAEEELETLKNEISEIRINLHKAFHEQDQFLTECLPIVKEHFPEFMCHHPELQMEMEYDSIVKQNRELDHFDLDVVSSSLWKTNSCEALHVLKECHTESKLKTDDFLRLLRNYTKIDCSNLVPIYSVFFSKTGREIYVQMPFYSRNLLDYSGSIYKILVAVLQALEVLHSNSLIHKKLTPKSIMVTDNEEIVVIPDIFPTTTRISKEPNPKFRGLDFTAPELRHESGIVSPSSDMYSFGCLMLWFLYPGVHFSMLDSGVPDLSKLPPSIPLTLISNLVSKVCRARPSAYSLLQSDILAKMDECLPTAHVETKNDLELATYDNYNADTVENVTGNMGMDQITSSMDSYQISESSQQNYENFANSQQYMTTAGHQQVSGNENESQHLPEEYAKSSECAYATQYYPTTTVEEQIGSTYPMEFYIQDSAEMNMPCISTFDSELLSQVSLNYASDCYQQQPCAEARDENDCEQTYVGTQDDNRSEVDSTSEQHVDLSNQSF